MLTNSTDQSDHATSAPRVMCRGSSVLCLGRLATGEHDSGSQFYTGCGFSHTRVKLGSVSNYIVFVSISIREVLSEASIVKVSII